MATTATSNTGKRSVMETRTKYVGGYSNANFDYMQWLAAALTDEDRANGVPDAPRYGYSESNVKRAWEAIDADIAERQNSWKGKSA